MTLDGGPPPAYLAVRDEAMHRLGVGTMHTMASILQGLFLASLQAREYTLAEQILRDDVLAHTARLTDAPLDVANGR